MLLGLEIVTSRESRKPGPNLARKICKRAFEKGLLTAHDGLYGNVFRITPALNITDKLAKLGLGMMEDTFGEVKRNTKN